MIVRNEAPVLERCLASALPLIDYACIVDTGSDDDTEAVARRFFQKHSIDCDVYRDTWRDFASNRNLAIEWTRRRKDVDYCLVLDAHDVIHVDAAFDARRFKEQMWFDVYDVRFRHGDTEHRRPALFETRLGCYYRGKVHEFLVLPAQVTRSDVDGFHLHTVQDGAHHRDPEKYLDDARVIEQAMQEETDPFMLSRYSFYLGQCYMRGGDLKRAIRAFYMRVRYGGWEQELFVSLLCIARIMVQLGYREERVMHAYLQAWAACPKRAEPLHDLAVYARKKHQFHWARLFAGQGMQLSKPTEGLAIESDVYAYKLMDEYAIAAYGCGDYPASLDACTHLLKAQALPGAERERVVGNASIALAHL
ncbi:MAG TPA: glycosyltransferase [Dyella sp.]|uniref:glycosyltransferase n=1 Tax=Dyella sp. TaxID=1869338 RepID=UPI002C1370A1|nr:glycosyltransferase [Dyella sp.]HTV87257.1 glycosyltransferase [Dyella sp.]